MVDARDTVVDIIRMEIAGLEDEMSRMLCIQLHCDQPNFPRMSFLVVIYPSDTCRDGRSCAVYVQD